MGIKFTWWQSTAIFHELDFMNILSHKQSKGASAHAQLYKAGLLTIVILYWCFHNYVRGVHNVRLLFLTRLLRRFVPQSFFYLNDWHSRCVVTTALSSFFSLLFLLDSLKSSCIASISIIELYLQVVTYLHAFWCLENYIIHRQSLLMI